MSLGSITVSMCRFVITLLLLDVLWGVAGPGRRVNAPYFESELRFPETAVFWFGRVSDLQNYTDVRVGYTGRELWIHLAIIDKWLWLDDSPSRMQESLELWDAATITLDTARTASTQPSGFSYRLVGELSWYQRRSDYQASYRGTGTGWGTADVPFATETAWRGNSPNDNVEDRGWSITFHIPFSSLGVSGPPSAGTVWRLGVLVHDRDFQGQTAVSDKFWPETFRRDQPDTWGELAFGLRPAKTGSISTMVQTYTLRNKLNGIAVMDAMVGGGSVCGAGTDFFAQWGSTNYAHSTYLVTQNQGDIADWPCFSKIYISFPMDSLPAGEVLVSAILTFYQFGNSDPSRAQPSLVQVLTLDDDWSEDTITWNNAPLAQENVSQAWVDPLSASIPWPGAARSWDVTWAASQAYAAAQPVLRLALYEADAEYHSGKYFTSSDTDDWNEAGRPVLVVKLADPGAARPAAPTNLRISQ